MKKNKVIQLGLVCLLILLPVKTNAQKGELTGRISPGSLSGLSGSVGSVVINTTSLAINSATIISGQLKKSRDETKANGMTPRSSLLAGVDFKLVGTATFTLFFEAISL
jgi:hypothetical protein